MSERAIDPVTLAVVNGTLRSVTREMGITLDRTSRSPVLKLARDYSNAVFDAGPRQLMQGEDIPVHLGAIQSSTRAVARYFEGEIHPGDIMYHNSPATGGSHKPDCTALKPVFWDDRLFFWVVNNAHLSDTGGTVPGGYNPLAEDMYAEGFRIPPIKICDRGIMRRDIVDMIVGSVRTTRHTRGDMRAQIGAVELAEKRLHGLLRRYGGDTVQACIEELLRAGERLMRREIAAMPDGVYEGVSWVEDDGHGSGPSRIRCVVEIRGDAMDVRMESRPQLSSYFNCYSAVTASAILLGVITYVDPSVPRNEGAYRAIGMDFGPAGSMLNAVEPAACSMSTTTPFDSIVEAVRDAMSKALPHRAVAGSSHMCFSIWSAPDPRSGEVYVFSAIPGLMGGGGASWGLDGWHCQGTVATSGAMLTGDIELTEHEYPLHTHFYELETDSACPGRWRGGLGGRYAIEPVGHETTMSSIGEGVQFPPPSLVGAASPYDRARVHRRWIVRADGTREDLPSHSLAKLRPGDVYHAFPPGGGAVGDPRERPVEAVRDDVRNGLVSVERAAAEYGVAIDPTTLEVDVEATRRRRSAAAGRPAAA
ncbi:MAG: hydantoinase B/oxoprolinase family protein [Deltaproteobacteria bacterium]|nr:hydantoinase B/oxoprolinase family protein [Deltaproteobacteria bacterium]